MTPLLGNFTPGLLFIVSAPAGTGKTTLIRMLMNEFPQVVASVSSTTRAPRKGEVHGKDYYFIDENTFKEKIAASDFFEYVNLYGTYYGTSRRLVQEERKRGKHVVLVIDTQGAAKIKSLSDFSVFIRPPSLEVLRERLKGRQTESAEVAEKRLEWAKIELNASEAYDYEIINEDLQTAYEVLRSILIAECHRTATMRSRQDLNRGDDNE